MARKDAQINIDSILQKIAESKSADAILQAAVYKKTSEGTRKSYELFYRSLLNQIAAHLRQGFMGAEYGGVISIGIRDERGNEAGSFQEFWEPLSDDYLATKARINKKYDTAGKYWVFRRNLQRSAGSSRRLLNPTVSMTSAKVKREGVLVRGKNRLTIRYSTGLTFSTLPPPLNELVRKPFVNGSTQGVEVWDSSPGSRKKGLKVLAYVEGRRPFIVELSGAVGRLARLRLGITS